MFAITRIFQLRAVLKQKKHAYVIECTSNTITHIYKYGFVYVYASSTLPFIVVSNRLSRCLDHCFRSLRSLFESIQSIDYKTLEHATGAIFS